MELTVEQSRDALKRTLAGLEEQASALQAAREQAAGDPLALLSTIGPVMAAVQYPIIKSLGFSEDDEGLMQFTVATKSNDSDEEVALLMARIHMAVLFGEPQDGAVPKLSLQPATPVSYEEVLLSARGAKPA